MPTYHYYVPEGNINAQLVFLELCRQKRTKPSHLINGWIHSYLLEQAKNVKVPTSPGKTTSEKKGLETWLVQNNRNARSKRKDLDAEWIRQKKERGI